MKFGCGTDLLKLTKENKLPIYEIMSRVEAAESGVDQAVILQRLKQSWKIMQQSITRPLNAVDGEYHGKIIGGESAKMWRYAQNEPLSGNKMGKALAYALAALEVNASMGKIVATPTAGSCGVLPAVLLSLSDNYGFKQDKVLNGLLTAGAVGLVYAKNATISGAVGGCQAEVGVASSMAAAAAVEMMGGCPQMALDAAAIAISNLLGLVCDPIAGLVESPCNTRNAVGVSNALLSADLVLAGVKAVVPFDQMVTAMYNVGRNMPPAVKETALGGMAATPAAMAWQEKIK